MPPKLTTRLSFAARGLRNLRVVNRRQVEVALADMHRDERFMKMYERCSEFTMTSLERMFAAHTAIDYVCDNGVDGDVVECGVWRGGSSMMMALTLTDRGSTERRLLLYDTFEGMTAPTGFDASIDGESAQAQYDRIPDWCAAPLDDVKANMFSTGYPPEQISCIVGPVEQTIPGPETPGRIAVLRLDTDWYESTKHELEHLYERLVPGGVLIVDDYGHWSGARKAVDEYFAAHDAKPLLARVDYTGRIAVKTSAR